MTRNPHSCRNEDGRQCGHAAPGVHDGRIGRPGAAVARRIVHRRAARTGRRHPDRPGAGARSAGRCARLHPPGGRAGMSWHEVARPSAWPRLARAHGSSPTKGTWECAEERTACPSEQPGVFQWTCRDCAEVVSDRGPEWDAGQPRTGRAIPNGGRRHRVAGLGRLTHTLLSPRRVKSLPGHALRPSTSATTTSPVCPDHACFPLVSHHDHLHVSIFLITLDLARRLRPLHLRTK
jgi:hypothetical protein